VFAVLDKLLAPLDRLLAAIDKRFVERVPRLTMTIIVVASVVFVTMAAAQEAANVLQWDWLLITGVLLLVWGLYLADRLPDQLRVTVRRLADRGVIPLEEHEIDTLVDALNARADVHSRRWGPLIALVILALFEFAGGIGERALLTLFEAV